MNPDTLAEAILAVLAPIADERRPGEPLALAASDIVLDRPRNRDHGDWASNIAMRLAKPFGTNPRELAQQIADGLAKIDGIQSTEVAGPGFINIRLDAAPRALWRRSSSTRVTSTATTTRRQGTASTSSS